MSDRKQILEIYQNKELSNQEKMRRINIIMNLGNSSPNNPETPTENECPPIPEIVSCSHYDRECMILSPCCHKWYSCRLCHDEEEDHNIDRYTINKMKCKLCN